MNYHNIDKACKTWYCCCLRNICALFGSFSLYSSRACCMTNLCLLFRISTFSYWIHGLRIWKVTGKCTLLWSFLSSAPVRRALYLQTGRILYSTLKTRLGAHVWTWNTLESQYITLHASRTYERAKGKQGYNPQRKRVKSWTYIPIFLSQVWQH